MENGYGRRTAYMEVSGIDRIWLRSIEIRYLHRAKNDMYGYN
jgi:hypothetical protein